MTPLTLVEARKDEAMVTASTADCLVAKPVVEFVAAVNRGDLDAAIAQLTPDHLHHGGVSSLRPEGVRVLFTLLREVMPDLRLDIRDMTVDGNRVVSRIVGTGVHSGSYLGKEPTGCPVTWQSVDIAEISRGSQKPEIAPNIRENDWRIFERFWDLFSDPSLWRQIGFKPAIAC